MPLPQGFNYYFLLPFTVIWDGCGKEIFLKSLSKGMTLLANHIYVTGPAGSCSLSIKTTLLIYQIHTRSPSNSCSWSFRLMFLVLFNSCFMSIKFMFTVLHVHVRQWISKNESKVSKCRGYLIEMWYH